MVLGWILATATPLLAQDGKATNFYIGGSANEGLTGLGDRVSTGYGGSAGFGLIPRPLSSGDIEFILKVSYDFLPTNLDSGPDFTFIRAGLDFKLRFWPSRTTTPYFAVGGGVSFNEWSSFERDGLTIEEITETKPFIAPGLGIEFRQKKVSPFFELRIVSISGQRIGDYRYIRATGGLAF